MAGRRWENACWKAIEKAERFLLHAVIFGVIALVVAQTLLTNDSLRFYLSWAERLEGQPISEWSVTRVMAPESGVFAHVTIEIKDFSSLAKASLLINGEKVADFKERRVTVKVYPDDLLEVDGSFYLRPLSFVVAETSAHIAAPLAGTVVETNRDKSSLGKVRFK